MDRAGQRLIDVRAERGANNALRLVFRDGPDEPFATARQEAGGGFGRKLGVLFGFKNGGTGTHELTVGGRSLGVVSKDGQPTDITDGVGGEVVARVERGATSTATAADGRALLTFAARGPEAKTPFPLLGARLVLDGPLDGPALDVLLAACVDIVIGLRPYISEMS